MRFFIAKAPDNYPEPNEAGKTRTLLFILFIQLTVLFLGVHKVYRAMHPPVKQQQPMTLDQQLEIIRKQPR